MDSDLLLKRDWLEGAAAYASAEIIGLISFGPLVTQTATVRPLGFLAILPLTWTALRRNQRDTATVALILSGFAVWGALLGGGPFADTSLNDSFLLLLMFMISTSIPSLALSADVAMRKRIEAESAACPRRVGSAGSGASDRTCRDPAGTQSGSKNGGAGSAYRRDRP